MAKAPDIVYSPFGEELWTWLATGTGSEYPRLRGRYRNAGGASYSPEFTLKYLDGSGCRRIPGF